MFFTAEQRRRAALVPPIHVALNHPSDAALIEASNSPSLTNCPISAEDIANARVIIYKQCKDCAEGKPYPLKGRNETSYTDSIPVQCRRLLRIHAYDSHDQQVISLPARCIIGADTVLTRTFQGCPNNLCGP
jgi:hypothetical protein